MAACWYGGALGAARVLLAAVRAGAADPHALAHLGAVDARSSRGSAPHLAVAAARGRRRPGRRPARGCRAPRLRARVEAGATEVLDRVGRALGAGPLCLDPVQAQRAADLPVYLRQSHAERDLAGCSARWPRSRRAVVTAIDGGPGRPRRAWLPFLAGSDCPPWSWTRRRTARSSSRRTPTTRCSASAACWRCWPRPARASQVRRRDRRRGEPPRRLGAGPAELAPRRVAETARGPRRPGPAAGRHAGSACPTAAAPRCEAPVRGGARRAGPRQLAARAVVRRRSPGPRGGRPGLRRGGGPDRGAGCSRTRCGPGTGPGPDDPRVPWRRARAVPLPAPVRAAKAPRGRRPSRTQVAPLGPGPADAPVLPPTRARPLRPALRGGVRVSLPPDYFDRMYAADADPWGFASRWYEQRKYALTLAALPRAALRRRRSRWAARSACSPPRWPRRCAALIALDPSRAALEAARGPRPAVASGWSRGRCRTDWPAGRVRPRGAVRGGLLPRRRRPGPAARAGRARPGAGRRRSWPATGGTRSRTTR